MRIIVLSILIMFRGTFCMAVSNLDVQIISHDVGELYSSKDLWISGVVNQVIEGLKKHQILVFPELFALSLGTYLNFSNESDLLKQVSQIYWDELVPKVLDVTRNNQPSLVILGSSPFYDSPTNSTFNRSAILINGKLHVQDKIHLTPWEKSFTSGETLHIFKFLNLKFVVTICLDIEMPQISYLLQKNSVDLIFVPSATEGMQGSERIQRTSSSRAVEVGAITFVAPLIGKNSKVDLISNNLGQLSRYTPSNILFDLSEQKILSPVVNGNGTQFKSYTLPVDRLLENKKYTGETKPFQLFKLHEIPVKINF